MKRTLLALLVAAHSSAAPFNITIANSAPAGTPAWSTGLLTLKPLIGLGRSPTPTTDAGAWATYQFANSHCDTNPGCAGAGCDNGNATHLAARWGLTLGVDAWLVPAISVGGSQTITIDAPVGSRLSYIAWVNDTSVFDDFVALHPPGTDFATLSTLSVPLFSGSTPLENVEFVISGYDTNSTSATSGSGATCTPECPVTGTSCFVAPGNATYGPAGTLNAATPPPVRNFTAVSGNGQARLAWTNAAPHSGVIIARRPSAAVTWAPTANTLYTAGQQVANQGGNPTTIVYAENGTAAAAFTNTTGLTNGTRYFYKVFSFVTVPGVTNGRTYSTGDVPSSAGLFTEPTSKVGQSPLWCYSVGFPSLQQPTHESGVRVFTSSNGGSLTGNTLQPGTQDGWEAWRPVQLAGPVQMRSTLVPLFGRTGGYLLTGDQAGRAWLVRSADGAVMWSTAALGNALQGQPVVQLYNFANAAFQAAHPNRDIIFFSTRNTTNPTTSNKVYGISSIDGSTVWTYAPGNLNIISGGMAVDYVNNRLWVASSGTTNSLRVLSTLTGAQVGVINLGPIDYGVNIRFVGSTATEAVVITNAGVAYGFDLATLTQRWTRSLGANATGWALPLPLGFVASVNGSVRRIDVFPDAGTVQRWSANVPGANGLAFDYPGATVFVGGTGSTVRRINYEDGGTVSAITMPGTPTTFGHPTFDSAASRLYVGTLDGRLCAYPVPFP